MPKRTCNATGRKKWRGAGLVPVALAALAILATPAARATIDLVTLPPRERSQITIYNQEDLTLVREQRTVTFAKGVNAIQFSWAGTLIDPTSLEIEFPGAQADAFRIVDATYPANTENMLVWHIEAAKPGPAPIEISCFASGLSWQADYVLVADPTETTLKTMEGWVKVTNRSGEDYANAETRLVVGEINLVEKIAELARRGVAVLAEGKGEMLRMEMRKARPMPAAAPASRMMLADMAGQAKPKEIRKEGVSDYFLYTVEGRETIEDEWAKRLPSFRVAQVPFKVSYEYDERKHGEGVVLFYKYKNDEEHKLGEQPLPDGRYAVYREKEGGGLAYVNSTSLKYVPMGEDIELNLGSDGLVVVEPKMMRFRRENLEYNEAGNDQRLGMVIGYDEVRDWVLEVRNSRPRPVDIKIVRYLEGDWTLDTDEKFEKKSAEKIEFKRTLEPLSEMRIPYTVTTRMGSRIHRGRSGARSKADAQAPHHPIGAAAAPKEGK